MFEFAGFRNGGPDVLLAETRYAAVTGIVLYAGQAMKMSAGLLCTGAVTGDTIYAICDVSCASTDVSAGFKPRVFPVTKNQIWKVPFATAITADACSVCTSLGIGSACATALNGALIGTAVIMLEFVTAPISAAWVCFQNTTIR